MSHAFEFANLPMSIAAAVSAASLLFGVIGVRAVLSPLAASAFFGVALEGRDGLAFVRAMGARNIALALTAVILVLAGSRSGVAGLLFAAAFCAALDAMIVHSAAGARRAAKHVVYCAGLTAFSLWVLAG